MSALPPSLVLAFALLSATEQALAERHIWTVPGTAGATYDAVHWDPATGTILATQGHRVVRIDPIRGERKGVAERFWETPRSLDEKPGPDLTALVPGPGGTLLLGSSDTYDGARENRVYLCLGKDDHPIIQTIAGKAHSRAFCGDAWNACATGLHPVGLAAGPGGTVFVADHLNGRVHLLRPWLEGGGHASGFRIEAIAGSSIAGQPSWSAHGAVQPLQDRRRALEVLLEPVSLAVTSEGAVLVADMRHRQVFLLEPPPGAGPGSWTLEVAAGSGGWAPTGEGDADARETHLGLPRGLTAGPAGQVYLRTSTRIWELAPCRDAEGSQRWRCRMVSALSSQVGTAPDGSPATRLPSSFFNALRCMAAGPGGGLLFTAAGEGIRYLGPASGEEALAARVQAYRQAAADQDLDRMRAIRDSLIQQRDEPAAIRTLARSGERSLPALADQPGFSRLSGYLLREIESFLIDPKLLNFRAALALEAIRTDPPERAR